MSFLGVKWWGHGVDHPSPPSAEVKERVEVQLYTPPGPSWPVLGITFTTSEMLQYPTFYHFQPLRANHLSQYPTVDHPQHTFS
jgi:hypothetical protein